MGSFLNTVWAQMLRGRELDRQRKLDEQLRTDEQRRIALRAGLEEQRLVENAKQAEFDRHRRVAEMEARAAAMQGDEVAPSGYFQPAVQEMANVAFRGGQVEREGALAERRQKKYETDTKRYDAELDYRSQIGGHLAGVDKSRPGRLTEFGRSVLPQVLDPNQPIPSFDKPVTERTPYSELYSPDGGGGDERLKHFDKMESYLNRAASQKAEWAAFAAAGKLSTLALQLRNYAAQGYDLPTAMKHLEELGEAPSGLIPYAHKLMTDEELQTLKRVRSASGAPPSPGRNAQQEIWGDEE